MARPIRIAHINNIRLFIVVFWFIPVVIITPLFYVFRDLLAWPFDVMAGEMLPVYISILMVGLLILSILGDELLSPLFSRCRASIPNYHPTKELIDLLVRGAFLAVIIGFFFTSIIIILHFNAILDLQWKMMNKLIPFFLVMGAGTLLHLGSAVIRIYRQKSAPEYHERDRYAGWRETVFNAIPLKLTICSFVIAAAISFGSPALIYLIWGRSLFTISYTLFVTAVMILFFPLHYFLYHFLLEWFAEKCDSLLPQ